MSRSSTALIAATAIVLPSLSQFATADKTPSTKSNSKQVASKKSGSKQQAASNYQVQMEDCDLDSDGHVDISDIVMIINEYGNDCTTTQCDTDVNRDQVIDMNDLLTVLANYGTLETPPPAQTLLSGVRACLQGKFSQDADTLRDLGVKNDVWMVSGFAVSAPHDVTEEEFFAATASDIENRFGTYLNNKTDLDADYDGMVILDIERPFHPRHLGNFINPEASTYDPVKFDAIVEAYKLRISVVREMMPNCKLGLFGFTTPHPHGNLETLGEQQRIMGYDLAAARGILDQVDVICPIVYQRWGQTDNHYGRIGSYTVNGIEVARTLQRTNGTTPEIQPLMSFKVFNGPSAHNKELIEVSDLADQMEVIKSLGVEEFMFWQGKDDLDGSNRISSRLGELLEELNNRADVMVADAN
ncbi:MAG: hypothetical protein CMJ29_12755 [Phycisphaerae bacterium]|nr:hypothetical protein [Phycisphaerae bacterium]|tara:strand:- start:101 stop:1342 length:1242 start_codon:yes stop_codon:yes gene_type:complete